MCSPLDSIVIFFFSLLVTADGGCFRRGKIAGTGIKNVWSYTATPLPTPCLQYVKCSLQIHIQWNLCKSNFKRNKKIRVIEINSSCLFFSLILYQAYVLQQEKHSLKYL